MVSAAVEPLAVTRRVPKRFLDADGGASPNLLIFCGAVSLVTISTIGYFLWRWRSD